MHVDAVIWAEHMLLFAYRRTQKRSVWLWLYKVWFERRCRFLLGYFVWWHNTKADSYILSALSRQYVAVPSWWSAWEMP